MAESLRNTVVTTLNNTLEVPKSWLNRLCGDLEPWQIVVYTGGTTFCLLKLKYFLFQDDETLTNRARKEFFRLMKKLPMIKKKVDEEMVKAKGSITEDMNKAIDGLFVLKLPEKGLEEAQLMKELQRYKDMSNPRWQKGMVSGTVYNGEERLTQVMAKAYGMFAWTNPLHPDVFPDVRKMEAEIVRMCCSMFNGNDETCGTVTTGGTESIMLACLAYRNLARERGIKIPEMIVPVTAHAAFDKSASFFHMKITHIPVDEKTRMVDVKAMKRAINSKTCMLVASAPQFPHGIIDPVREVAELGLKYGIPVHVDSCLGGFLLPFMVKAGFPLEPFDFRVKGVTSISADTHKYGFAPKGSSVIMYSDKMYRSKQFFVQPDWTGGIYASPTMAGSRAGAIIAACWATMMYYGEEGYVSTTRSIVETTRDIVKCLKSVHGIFVFGDPKVSVIGIGSDDFNVFRLFEVLVEKGWILNSLQYPSSLHLCVTLNHTRPGVAERFVKDVAESVTEMMKNPKAEPAGAGAIYGMAQSIPDRSLVSEIVGTYLDACYNTENPPSASMKDSHGDSNGVLPKASNGDTHQ